MKSRTLILFLIVLACYLILIIYGLNKVYTQPFPVSKEIPLTKPENKIAIAHTEIFGVLERPQVIFEHQKHVDALVKEGKKDWETCSVCHPVIDNELKPTFPKKVDKKDKDSIMNAYHDECMDCHKQKLKEGKKSGPLVCGDCHSKEKEGLKIKYPVKEFDFKAHYDHVEKLKKRTGKKDCSLCHHIYDIEEEKEELRLVYEEGKEESCYYCHDLNKKKGPKYSRIAKVAAEKGLNLQKASHQLCLNCHVSINKEGKLTKDEKLPPLECIKCHDGKYRTVAELEKVPRPERDQEEKVFLKIDDAKMKGVGFSHKNHEFYQKTCRSCHHETLNEKCKECHTLTGSADGNWINTAGAYHSVFSEWSCAGCHNKKKAEKDCSGCHSIIPPIDIKAKNPKKEVCDKCHTDKKEIVIPEAFSTAKLDPEIVKKEVEVKVLEKEFEPAKFPHRKIIDRLVKVSNDSKMAKYFHAKLETLCDGCHHQSRAEAEAKKDAKPYCRNCHSISFDPLNPNKLRLQAAYHIQCIGCHESMKLEKPTRKCTDCHKEKKMRPSAIITKSESVKEK